MGFGECCCTCLKGFCAIPVGGLIAVAGICLGGIMGLSGLDDAAAVLEGVGLSRMLNHGGWLYLQIAGVVVILISLLVVYRGLAAELRLLGCEVGCMPLLKRCCPGLESALARCCACLFDNAYGIVMHVLLWISVIFTMVFCIIAEAIAIIVLAADRACALQETHGVTLILSSTYALILGMLNDPPINAGLPAIDITNTTDARIREMCDVSPVLLEASGKIVGGGVMLLLASVVQLAHWTKYSKAWALSSYKNFEGSAAEREGLEMDNGVHQRA